MLGEINIEETVLRQGSGTVHPLAKLLGLKPRGSTLNLQRAVVDFGAEESFAQASERLELHHQVKLSQSTVRKITLEHASNIEQINAAQASKGLLPAKGPEKIVAEIDGTMLPVVTTDPGDDKNARKHRDCQWKEVRLAAAKEPDKVDATYAVSAGVDVEQAGYAWAQAVDKAGWAIDTQIHALGDGAEWIFLQYKQMFGNSAGRYLLDLYHVSEYLHEAGKGTAALGSHWAKQQKDRLLEGDLEGVLQSLQQHLEDESLEDSKAPVRKAYRYLNSRKDQLDYPGAKAEDLPVGSGMIEGAHRHVLQNRLKKSGAWWKQDNLYAMAHLRVARANKEEDLYWNDLKNAA